MKYTKRMKLVTAVAAGCFVASGLFAQTVGLQIQRFGFNDVNNEGVAAAFVYGIVVDTTGEGFNAGSWGPSDITNRSFLNLEDGTATGNFFGARNVAQFNEAQSLYGYAHNVVIDHDDGRGLGYPSTGDQFGIIWFPNLTSGDSIGAGESYGFYTNENLILPASAATVNFSSFITEGPKSADYTIVPEPSTYAAIFGFGVLLFVFLRRRFKK